jgi:hypothetical protein
MCKADITFFELRAMSKEYKVFFKKKKISSYNCTLGKDLWG